MKTSTRSQLANAIRALSMDAIEKANSGHPGAPLGMADIAEVVWNDFLHHNPVNPHWVNRDRFILSNGHGSMLLYSLLHLSGYELTLEDIQSFRQLHSKTAGHPECDLVPGVETTTGPLGQGIGNGAGMALAEKMLADTFNRGDLKPVDHFTYVFMGDGCLMEGVAHEAVSLAGTLGLGKLIVCWDDNNISIDGEVGAWFSEDVPARFEACGWQVIRDVDGHNPDAVKGAVAEAKIQTLKPTLICCKTIIGFGSPGKGGTSACHGAPFGPEEIEATRKQLNWPHAPFTIPEEIYKGWDARPKGAELEKDWNEMFSIYSKQYPDLAVELQRRLAGELPDSFSTLAEEFIAELEKEGKDLASRKSAQVALEKYAAYLPELLGGSADLTGSNLTNWSGTVPVEPGKPFIGNYIRYGVREFGMTAMMNGMALHGGFVPYAGTFLVFADYARNGIRMAALMKQRVIFILTHDSIGVGEDGPTHQPVEHVASLRLIPGLTLWRPADTVEAAVSWQQAIEKTDGPTCLILSRQTLPHNPRTSEQTTCISRGGYIVYGGKENPEAIIIATGSEVGVAVKAAALMGEKGHNVRVVSMVSVERFEEQEQKYRDTVLPPSVPTRVAIEAGSSMGWHKYVGSRGRVIGIDRFGKSAPGEVLFEYFGITVKNTVTVLSKIIAGHSAGAQG